MPSPLAALMGLASGAMGLLQKVFNQGNHQAGFEAQLTAALEGGPGGGVPLLQEILAGQGSTDGDLVSSLLGNTQAVPLLHYLSALQSLSLTREDARSLLLGNGQGISPEGLKAILVSCGCKEAEITQLMSDPDRLAELKTQLAGAVSGKIHGQLAGTGLNVEQLIGQATGDQATYEAVVAQFVVSGGGPKSSGRAEEGLTQPPGTNPAEITKIAAEIKESVASLLKNQGAAPSTNTATVSGGIIPEGASETSPEAIIQVMKAVDDLEYSLNIPKKVVRDLFFATDPQVRQAAGDEATARITEFLEANTGKELPKQAAATLSMLKGILSQQEFAGIDQALKSFNPDLTATIQPFTFDKGLFDVLAKSLGEEPSGMRGSYTQEVLDQIRRAVPTGVKGNEGSMSLKLNPPMLGRLDIDIRVEDGRITATFKAEQPLTRDILQQNMHVLKEAFSDQGIKATQFVVTTDAFTARDHREALAWFGSGTGRGGSRGQGGGQDTGDASRRDEALGHGYTPVRRYGEGGGLDIFA